MWSKVPSGWRNVCLIEFVIVTLNYSEGSRFFASDFYVFNQWWWTGNYVSTMFTINVVYWVSKLRQCSRGHNMFTNK